MPLRVYGSRDRVRDSFFTTGSSGSSDRSGTSCKLQSLQLHRSAVQRVILVVPLVASLDSSQLCAPCASTFCVLFAALVSPAGFSHRSWGRRGLVVDRSVITFRSLQLKVPEIHAFYFLLFGSSGAASNDYELTGAQAKISCTHIGGIGHMRTYYQLTLLWSAASRYTLTSR